MSGYGYNRPPSLSYLLCLFDISSQIPASIHCVIAFALPFNSAVIKHALQKKPSLWYLPFGFLLETHHHHRLLIKMVELHKHQGYFANILDEGSQWEGK